MTKISLFFLVSIPFVLYYLAVFILQVMGQTNIYVFSVVSKLIVALTGIVLIASFKLKKLNLLSSLILGFMIWYIFNVFITYAVRGHESLYSFDLVYILVQFVLSALIPYLSFNSIPNELIYKSLKRNVIFFGLFFTSLSIIIFLPDFITYKVNRISDLRYFTTGAISFSPINLGYTAATIFIIAIHSFFFRKGRALFSALVYIYLILASVIVIYLSATRGAFIAIFLPTIYLLIRLKVWSLFLFILGIMVSFYFVNDFAYFTYVFDRSDSGRGDLWQNIIEASGFNLFGTGVLYEGIYVHNIFLEAFYTSGVIGFILFSSVMIVALRGVFKKSLSAPAILINMLLILVLIQYSFSQSLWGAILLWPVLGMISSNFQDDLISN